MTFPLKAFRGIFPAAMTMFDKEQKIDENATARHWEWLIDQGADGLVIAGTSGEFIALDSEERIRLFKLAKDIVAGRVPLIYGAGHYSTKRTIQLCEAAQALGASGVIVILPYYQKPPKPAVIQHFRQVREATDVPIMLYNNPANSACVELSSREIASLVDEDVIHMVKSTFESVVPVHELSFLVGDRMAIFYGSFHAAFEGLMAGAHGWISGLLNIIPSAAKAMYRACILENDARKGLLIWKKILPLVFLYTHQQLGAVSDLAIYRSILKLWGLNGGYSQPPILPLNSEQENLLRIRLEESGWINPLYLSDDSINEESFTGD